MRYFAREIDVRTVARIARRRLLSYADLTFYELQTLSHLGIVGSP
jgi:hypothetical protein